MRDNLSILNVRLELVKKLSDRELPIEEFEKILLELSRDFEDIDRLKMSIADLIKVKNSRVSLSREGLLLLSLLR